MPLFWWILAVKYFVCTAMVMAMSSNGTFYKTRDLARADVFDYIEVFYNRTRRHSHLGGVSPEAFERASN